MIYIIFDESHEWDDLTYSPEIKFMSTCRELAEAAFEKYFGDTEAKHSEKYCFSYDLYEYPDGYDYYMAFGSPGVDKRRKLIRHIDNSEE